MKSEESCTMFSGTFNGNNHKVVGMKMNFTWALGGAGLFCGVVNTTFKDLTFDETCSIASNGTAAMLSVLGSGTVTLENIRNEGSVTAAKAAGIFGMFMGTSLKVVRCVNSGTIAGNERAQFLGGIVSEAIVNQYIPGRGDAVFEQCINKGTITATSTQNQLSVGGIVSYAALGVNKVVECANEGDISVVVENQKKPVTVGGIVSTTSYYSSVEVTRCSNKGTITVKSDDYCAAAGIFGHMLGHNKTITISDSYNAGDVLANGAGIGVASGIIGQYAGESHGTLVISKCNNTATIQKLKARSGVAAGIVGLIQGTPEQSINVTDCMNLGKVQASSEACGIICGTDITKRTITNSGNTGAVSGASASGISNLVSAADNVANTGTVTGTTNTAALWKSCPEGKCTNAFQNQDKNDKETFIAKSKHDQCYYTDESSKNVYTLLNDQKEAKYYSLFWDTKLVLDFSGTKPSGKC